jgi:hypothetical protein
MPPSDVAAMTGGRPGTVFIPGGKVTITVKGDIRKSDIREWN